MDFTEVLTHELATLRQEYETVCHTHLRMRDEANEAQVRANMIAQRVHAVEETLRAYQRTDLLVYQETA